MLQIIIMKLKKCFISGLPTFSLTAVVVTDRELEVERPPLHDLPSEKGPALHRPPQRPPASISRSQQAQVSTLLCRRLRN